MHLSIDQRTRMDKRVIIKDKFAEQYTLTIDSDIKGVNIHMTSRSQMRWDFNVLDTRGDQLEIRLILLDHKLLQANNPLIKEVAALTSSFSRLYNELHLLISREGEIMEVLNMDVILSKWKQTKAEMEEVVDANPDIRNAITLNDNVFNNKSKVVENIQSSEFFLLYFNKIYGRQIPDSYKQNALNFFNSANVHWSFKLKDIPDPRLPEDEALIELLGAPAVPLGPGFYNRAYIQFDRLINIKKLDTTLLEKGIFRINKNTGRLVEASLLREEIADKEDLYTKMKYTIYSEEILKSKLAE